MKRVFILTLLIFRVFLVSFAQEISNEEPVETDAPFISTIRLTGGPVFPIGTTGDMYRTGGSGAFSAHHRLGRMPFLNLQTSVGFRGTPLLDQSSSLLFTDLSAGVGLEVEIIPRFNFEAYITGGLFVGTLIEPAEVGVGGVITGGVLFGFDISERWRIGLGSNYRSYIGLAGQITADLAGSYRFDFRLDDPFRGSPLELEPFYPELYGYYAGGMPVGRVSLANRGNADWKKMTVHFDVPGVSEGRFTVSSPSSLTQGETLDVALTGSFSDRSIRAAAGSPAEATVDIGFRYKGWPQDRSLKHSLEIRSASFSDDPAARVLFVASRDPVVREWASVLTNLDFEVTSELNNALLNAALIYDGLGLAGFRQTATGSDVWSSILSGSSTTNRFPFPRNTLTGLLGDRSETAILMVSLLEAAGSTAGLAMIDSTLWPAVMLGEGPERIAAEYSRPEDLILVNGTGWVVMDMSVPDDFLNAMASGAEAWRQAETPDLVVCRESWNTYPQAGYSRDPIPFATPGGDSLTGTWTETINDLVLWEISARAAELKSSIKMRPRDIGLLNKLGVLLARYGLREESREWFDKVLLIADDSRVLVNLGNIEYLKGDLSRARTYYTQASRVDPFNPYVLLGVARVTFEQENFGSSREAYSKLEIVDPELADRFSILTGTGPDALKAALDSDLRRLVFWLE